MIEVPVYSLNGEQSGSVEIDESLLGGEVRPVLLKQAYVAFHANRRQGTAQTRGRGEVAGSTRKLYRQKGTGRARRGAIRTNLLRGGGVAFGKKPKEWRQKLPTRMRRLANRNALLSKIVDQEIRVIEPFNFEAPKTRNFVQVLDALNIDRSCLLALDPGDRNTALSARNVPHVDLLQIDQLNAFDLLNHRYLVVEKPVLQRYLDELKPVSKSAVDAAEKEAA
jgi:large subunit ribosomal protein L4